LPYICSVISLLQTKKSMVMKKILLSFLFFCLSAIVVHAQVTYPHTLPLTHADFFRADAMGANPTLERDFYSATTDLIKANQWNRGATTTAGSSPTVENSALSYSTYIDNAAGKAVVFGGTSTRRTIYSLTDDSFGYRDKGNFYLSFLVNLSAVSATVQFIYWDGNHTANQGRGMVYVKSDGAGGFNIGLGLNAAPSTWSSSLSLNQTHLVVMRVEPKASADYDYALYVNPTIGNTEAESASSKIIQFTHVGTTVSRLAGIKGITIQQISGIAGKLAGLRFSNSWADVVKAASGSPLSTPSLKKANAVSNSGFRAYWNAVANASSYDVKVYNGATQFGSTHNTTSTSLAITGLSANTSYTYTVTAKGTGGYTDSQESAFSATVTTLTSDKNYVLSQYADTEVADLKSDLIAGHSEIYELTTSGGAYQFSSTAATNITLTSSATIRALSGLASKPVISINNSNTTATSNIFAINAANVSLRLEGLEFNGINANTAGTPIQNILVYGLTTSTNAAVIVRDCYIRDFKNAGGHGTFRFDEDGGSIDIQGSNMKDCSGRVINFYTVSKVYGDVTLKNNTFSNIGADVSATGGFLYYRSVSPNVAAATTVTIDHCTFDTYTSSANNILRINNAMSGLVSLRNSIFTSIAGGLNFNGSNGFVIDNCYLGGFATTVEAGTNRTVTNTLSTEPSYTNTAANNFVLTNKSALICDNGYVAGNTYGAVLTPLTATTALAASDIIGEGFTANWESKANATGYIVNVYKEASLVKSTRVGAVTSASITEMTPNTSYTYKVIAVGDAENYSSSVESTASASFTTSNIFNLTGTTTISALTSKNTSSVINVATGATLTIDEVAEVNSITAAAGARLTINNTLTTNGALTLESDAGGTATLMDSYGTPTINATVKQHVTAGRNWYVSPSVTGAVYSVLNRGASVVEWDETIKDWVPKSSGTLTPGKGYIQVATVAQGSTGTIDFNGLTNSGTIPVSVTRTESGSSRGYNLVGNPYPSYLNWEQVLNLNATNESLLQSSIWYRTATYNNVAGKFDYTFNTYNSTSRVAVPTNTSGYIPPMQAFWVRANSNGTVTFTNDMRSHGNGQSNLLKAPKEDTRKLIRIQVSNSANSTDETVLYFDENALNTFDKYDSEKMFNNVASKPEIFTKAGSERLVINGMNALPLDTELPLGFVTGVAGNFSISPTELTNFDSDTRIMLKDNLNPATEFELSEGVSYDFSAPVTTATTDRFSLVFRAPGTTTALNQQLNLHLLVFANAAGQIEIHAPAKSQYAVFNAMGQQLAKGTTTSGIQTLNLNLASGMYVVKVNNSSKKVIIK